MTGGFSDDFAKLNANVDFIAHHLADVIRSSMRASVSGDPWSQTHAATQKFAQLLHLLKHAENISLSKILEKAIEDLRPERPVDWYELCVSNAAQSGLRFVIERSCSDQAAHGRASKREYEFLHMIERIEQAKDKL